MPRTQPAGPAGNPWRAALAVLASVLLLSGCGAGELVKDTMNYVGSYFEKDDSSLRRRLVVIPFHSSLEGLGNVANELDQHVRQKLGSLGGVALLPEAPLLEVLPQVPASVTSRSERLILAGRRLGLNTILQGQITDLSTAYDLTGIYGFRENTPFLRLEVDLTLSDVATGTTLGRQAFVERTKLDDVTAEQIRMGTPPEARLVAKLTKEMKEQLDDWLKDTLAKQRWTGYVMEVQDNEHVLTSVGQDTGIPVGTILFLYGHGQRVMTGAGWPVFMPGPQLGKLQITRLEASQAWAKFLPADQPELAKEGADGGDATKEPQPEPEPQPVTPGMLIRVR